jgi:hypothetical protein
MRQVAVVAALDEGKSNVRQAHMPTLASVFLTGTCAIVENESHDVEALRNHPAR